MADLSIRANNSGYFNVRVWRDKDASIPLDISEYDFELLVNDELNRTIWRVEKTEYDEYDAPTEGRFRIHFDRNLTKNRGTFVLVVNMVGTDITTLFVGNLVIA